MKINSCHFYKGIMLIFIFLMVNLSACGINLSSIQNLNMQNEEQSSKVSVTDESLNESKKDKLETDNLLTNIVMEKSNLNRGITSSIDVYSSIVSDGEWTYFGLHGNNNTRDTCDLYRIPVNGGTPELVREMSVDENLFINGDWIYGCNNFKEIIKVSLNGQEQIVLADSSQYKIYDVTDDSIFYFNDGFFDDSMKTGIYRMDLDGSNIQQIPIDEYIEFYDEVQYILDGWVYYIQNDKLQRVSVDGKEHQDICDGYPIFPHYAFTLDGNCIYYYCKNDSCIYKVIIGEDNSEYLCEGGSDNIRYMNGYVYSGSIKIDVKTGESELLYHGTDIADGWGYSYSSLDDYCKIIELSNPKHCFKIDHDEVTELFD